MPEASRAAAPATASTREEQKSGNLLDRIVAEGRFSTDSRGKDLIKEFVSQVSKGAMTVSKEADTDSALSARIAHIDKLISEQLNEILHHPDLQRLEASWRGLRYLLDQSETGERLKIKVLNATKRELLRDLQRASEFDQSALFKKVYEEEFGVFGGMPFGALIGDYEFGRIGEDVELLEKIGQVAAAAHAPFISSAAPQMLNLTNFTTLGGFSDVGRVFDSTEYARWKSFRNSDDSRYVGLVLPHILLRLPYGAGVRTIEAFNYEEGVDGSDHSKYLWGNAAYALAAKLTIAFGRFGWCAAIRGVEGGGLVEDLPTHTFRTDEGDVALKCPTEVAITDRRERELSDQGLIALVHRKNTGDAAFFSVQSCNKPKLYDTDSANANARLSAQLPYILAMSRFAHYLKAMMRDKLGSFISRMDCQRFLNNWISQYVTADDTATQSVKAQHPLREAHIEVDEVPGKPGVYRATAFLRPHFQLDELTGSLRLVAELPASVRK